MTEIEFLHIIENNPELTAQGFNIKNDNATDFPTERNKVYSLFNRANVCEFWLAQCSKTKKIQRKIGNSAYVVQRFDYWYKADTGHWPDLTEGALLIAAIYLGLTCEKKEGKPGFYMNISNRRKIDDRWLNEYCM